METLSKSQEIRRIVEALLFTSHEPLTLQKMREILDVKHPVTAKELTALLGELKRDYQSDGRGFQLFELGGGYLLRTAAETAPFVELLHASRRSEKLSKAALEVLAIVAYKQPLTRAEIEKIRGVDSSGTIASLLERELIEGVGRLEMPGRPMQYGTTRKFLVHFGLKAIDELASDTPLQPASQKTLAQA